MEWMKTDEMSSPLTDRQEECPILQVSEVLVIAQEAIDRAVGANGGKAPERFGEVAVQERSQIPV